MDRLVLRVLCGSLEGFEGDDDEEEEALVVLCGCARKGKAMYTIFAMFVFSVKLVTKTDAVWIWYVWGLTGTAK